GSFQGSSRRPHSADPTRSGSSLFRRGRESGRDGIVRRPLHLLRLPAPEFPALFWKTSSPIYRSLRGFRLSHRLLAFLSGGTRSKPPAGGFPPPAAPGGRGRPPPAILYDSSGLKR